MPHVHHKDSLVKALKGLQENKLSLRAAARGYGIPCSMLPDYAIGKSTVGSTSVPDTVLTKAEEWALKMADISYGQTGRQTCEAVKHNLDHIKWSNPFTEK